MNDPIAKTYVYCGDKAFYVSTINRPSSSVMAHGDLYAETMAWEWDKETRAVGQLIGQGSSYSGSLFEHTRAVKSLRENGVYLEEEND